MPDIIIEQAVYGSQDAGGYQFLARSSGFLDDWLPHAQRLCTGFGERPAFVACPECVLAQPFGPRHVAVVQVADQGGDANGRPGALAFRLLVLGSDAYAWLGGDPFALAERFPPSWGERGTLGALSIPGDRPPPPRTLAEVQATLERHQHMQATLLGSVQALVDGGRVVFERSEPALVLLRALWMLLPTSTRAGLWPASFAFGNALGFDVLVVPRAEGEEYAGYVVESQAGDYPEGRYELNLQIAAETNDQAGLDALFGRRSRREVWRLALLLLGLAFILMVTVRLLSPSLPPPEEGSARETALKPDLPDELAPLNDEERRRLTPALRALAEKVSVPAPLPDSAEELIDALDRRLGTPDARRDPGPLHEQGPTLRRLRLLLWKHGVAEYNDLRRNPKELVEKLDERLSAARRDSAREGAP